MEFVLASASPRRLELLNLIGIHPRVIVPSVNEDRMDEESLENYVKRVALAKGASVIGESGVDSVLLSADTVVALGDRILGKPVDRAHARMILKALSGVRHEVWTGISLFYRDQVIFDISRTAVYFEHISDREMNDYLDNESFRDKAGAYAIQGRAAVFVNRIEGCYFNVMGLPLNLFSRMMKTMGLPIDAFGTEKK